MKNTPTARWAGSHLTNTHANGHNTTNNNQQPSKHPVHKTKPGQPSSAEVAPRPRRLVISDHAFSQLSNLHHAIPAPSGSQETADGYMRALHAYLRHLPDFPMRGRARPDIHGAESDTIQTRALGVCQYFCVSGFEVRGMPPLGFSYS